MMELGVLAGIAVGIAGDFLAGVVQDVAAGTVTDLVRQRLGATDDGTRALGRLEETPQDSGRRMEAASMLASAAQGDPSFAQDLNDAVNIHHQDTDQGTATSGSPHHQVNISGGGISGKGHQVAGGNIDNSKKHNIRIGFGAFALLAVVLGGYGVMQWVSGDSGTEKSEQPSISGGARGEPGSNTGKPQASDASAVNFDIKGTLTGRLGTKIVYRSRGEVTATVGRPAQSDDACGLKALPGTSIVPVALELTNTNDPLWEDSANFRPDSVAMSVKELPRGVKIYTQNAAVTCGSGFLFGGRIEPGSVNTATLIMQGVPAGKEVEITFEVVGPDKVHEKYEEGIKYEEGRKLFSVPVQG
ncbi:hypothetical protein ACUN29_41535 (plasmid) [Streptomyces sp. WC2508]|uniref:hypothetical protein n=1 Tax=Streptomyces sp. WC2508 TaxID=3461405 RepID=UPI004044C465